LRREKALRQRMAELLSVAKGGDLNAFFNLNPLATWSMSWWEIRARARGLAGALPTIRDDVKSGLTKNEHPITQRSPARRSIDGEPSQDA
jgi:hypothetical protein